MLILHLIFSYKINHKIIKTMRNSGFRKIYMSLPREDKHQVKVRDKITTTCKVSKQSFYNWLMQITKIPNEHLESIAQVLDCKTTDLT